MVARRALLPRAPSHLAFPKKPTRVSTPAPRQGRLPLDPAGKNLHIGLTC